MQHLDEGTIHAWLDGALSVEDGARLEAHIADCTDCAAVVAEARGLIAASSRILTALDDVPNVRGAKGAEGAWRGRPFLTKWLAGERIAAAAALLMIGGGALLVAVSRDGSESARVHVASEPVDAFELAAADTFSPPPTSAPAAPEKDRAAIGRVGGRPQPAVSRERDLSANRGPVSGSGVATSAVATDSASLPLAAAEVAQVTTQAAAAPAGRTDDTARLVLEERVRRVEQQQAAEGKSSISEKLADAFPRRQVADAAARFTEPRPTAPPSAAVVGASAVADDPRLVQEERATEEGRETHRRIYRIDGILVTLDERNAAPADERRMARAETYAAPAPAAAVRPDTAQPVTNTIRWTDERGVERTLTGPASEARLQRIKTLLGY